VRVSIAKIADEIPLFMRPSMVREADDRSAFLDEMLEFQLVTTISSVQWRELLD
jgi:hypothetical protein